jgi:hypothetical protein
MYGLQHGHRYKRGRSTTIKNRKKKPRSYNVTFSLSQMWPLNIGLTVFTFIIFHLKILRSKPEMLNIYKLLHFKEVIMLQIPIYCPRPCFRRYQLLWLEEKYTEEFLHSLNSKDFFHYNCILILLCTFFSCFSTFMRSIFLNSDKKILSFYTEKSLLLMRYPFSKLETFSKIQNPYTS